MVDQTFTISLVGNDGEDDSNTATVVMTVRAIVATDVAGTVTAGDPTASGSLTILNAPNINTIPEHANEVVRALITLSDFNEGDAVNENWFRIASSLGSVSADSDMLIAANLTLDRMRWRSSDQRVTLNRTGTASMLDYFGTGDPGRTQFIFIAVADSEDHIAEIDIDAEFGTATISQLRLDTIPAAAQALLNLVQPEGVINLVIADEGPPPTDVAGEATAGDPTATGNVSAIAPPPPTNVAGVATAGDPTATGDVTTVAPLDVDVAGTATAGDPTVSGDLTAIDPLPPTAPMCLALRNALAPLACPVT